MSERGFPINKYLLDAQGASAKEDIIISIMFVKDEHYHVAGVIKF